MMKNNKRSWPKWTAIFSSTALWTKRNENIALFQCERHCLMATTCGCLSLRTLIAAVVLTSSIQSNSLRNSSLIIQVGQNLSSSRLLLLPTTSPCKINRTVWLLKNCLNHSPVSPARPRLRNQAHQRAHNRPRSSHLSPLHRLRLTFSSSKSTSRSRCWSSSANLISACGSWSHPSTSATISRKVTSGCRDRNMTWHRLIT